MVTFNEPINIGTGDITIKNITDNTQIVIDVTDDFQVSRSGAVLTINPIEDLPLAKLCRTDRCRRCCGSIDLGISRNFG